MTPPPDPATEAADPAPRRGGPQRIPVPEGGSRPGAGAPWAHLAADLRRPTLAEVRAALAGAGPAVESPVERGGFAGAASIPARGRRLMPTGDRPPVPSAVLAPLYERDGEAWVVLTRRGLAMRAHAGEVAFPGGRREAGDRDLVHTALRESEEEIGLDPGSVEIIGELDHLATVTSGSVIIPWVGALPGPPDVRPRSVEVDGVIEVALAELMSPGVFREEVWDLGGIHRPIVFFDLVGDTVWGATAAMLRQLLGLVTGTVARGELGHD